MYCYWNDGISCWSCDDVYEAGPGEVLFPDTPTPEELAMAFPGYVAAITGQLRGQYTQAAQELLDATARTRGYDGILSLCSYATSENAPFKAEALAGVKWRDAVWLEGYTILAQVQAGSMAPPSLPEFLAMLPAISWPTA